MRNVQKLEGSPITMAADGVSNTIDLTSFRNANITVWNAANSTLTLRVRGTTAITPPDFTAAASATNPWAYVQMVDLEDASVLNGNEGLPLSGAAAGARQFELNSNAITFFAFEVSSRSAGSVVINGNKSEAD